jgi:hypothetical protein
MFFTLQNTVALLALSGAASAKGLNQKRDVTNTALYAYGTNISGASVFYGDGTHLSFPILSPFPNSCV